MEPQKLPFDEDALPDREEEDAHWGLYLGVRNGHDAMITVNLALVAVEPHPERPVWVDVSLPLRDPDENGWPAPDELDQLRGLEDRLLAAMQEAGAVYAGAWNAGGWRHWFFYAPPVELKPVVERIFAEGHAQNHTLHTQHDPDWALYRDHLFPDRAGLRFIQDSEVLATLAMHGDIGELPRKIEHLAYFDTPEQAQDFAEWARQHEFDVEEIGEDPEDEQRRHCVQFSHVGPAHPFAINEKTALAEEAAEELGGEYDGWFTEVMRG